MAFLKFVKSAVIGSEEPKFTVEKQDTDYEIRSYPECHWVTLALKDKKPDDCDRTVFRRLFGYINGQNDKSLSIDMAKPVAFKVSTENEKDAQVSFFIPPSVGSPPKPTDEGLKAESSPERKVFVRTFGGKAQAEDWKREYETLLSKIPSTESLETSFYVRAGYDPPFKMFNRRNEVWVFAKENTN